MIYLRKIVICLICVVFASFFFVLYLDLKLSNIVDEYINEEVERLTTNIINKYVNEVMQDKNYRQLLIIEDNNLNYRSYDTKKINKLKNDVGVYVHERLINLEDGDIDDVFLSNRITKGKFRAIKHGILCDVSLGSVRGSVLFNSIGPTVPIKLLFVGQVQTDVDVKVREYGINNVLLELSLIIKVKEQISMPITSKRKEIIVKEPLSIDIIKGEIPNYYSGWKE